MTWWRNLWVTWLLCGLITFLGVVATWFCFLGTWLFILAQQPNLLIIWWSCCLVVLLLCQATCSPHSTVTRWCKDSLHCWPGYLVIKILSWNWLIIIHSFIPSNVTSLSAAPVWNTYNSFYGLVAWWVNGLVTGDLLHTDLPGNLSISVLSSWCHCDLITRTLPLFVSMTFYTCVDNLLIDSMTHLLCWWPIIEFNVKFCISGQW